MRLGVVILPEHPWREGRAIWQRAEALGFDHVWTYDHLSWRTLRDDPWFDAMPTLTAAALATERIRLGTLVASPNFRHPVPFAKELMTLDDISGGRLTLGIGSGGTGWDATVLGTPAWSPRERAAADGARNIPGCVQQPRVPLAIAATGPRAMRLAVTYGQTWVTTGDRGPESKLSAEEGAAVVRGQIDRLDRECGAAGRDPGSP